MSNNNTTSKVLFQLKSNEKSKKNKPNNLKFLDEYDSEKEEEYLIKKSQQESQKRKRENKPLVIPSVKDNKKPKLVIENSATIKEKQPILLANRIADLSSITNEKEKFSKDLSLRANDISETSNVYYNIPIEEFGAAMLRGMGWKGSEKELKEEDVPKRYYRLGLGSLVTVADEKEEKEKEEGKKELCQKELQVGSIITLPNNPNRAKVLQTLGVPGLNQIKIQYEHETTPVHVNRREIKLLPYKSLIQNPFIQETTDAKPPQTTTQTNNIPSTSSNSSKNNTDTQTKSIKNQTTTWITPNIKVRIISKSFSSGQYYKQKGVILDTPTPSTAFVQMDNKTITISQEYLETVIPKVNKPVMILKGKYKFQKGVVTRRNFDKERVYVQLLEDDCIVKLELEDVSEYCHL